MDRLVISSASIIYSDAIKAGTTKLQDRVVT